MVEVKISNISYGESFLGDLHNFSFDELKDHITDNAYRGFENYKMSDISVRALAACKYLNDYFKLFDIDCTFSIDTDKKYIRCAIREQKFYIDYDFLEIDELAYVLIKELSKLCDLD